jgi:hypothetical protein
MTQESLKACMSHIYQDRAVAIEMKYFWRTRKKTFGTKRKYGRWFIRTKDGWEQFDVGEEVA